MAARLVHLSLQQTRNMRAVGQARQRRDQVVANYSISYVFVAFAIVLALGGVICLLFAPETKGRVLEELSP
jgi:uncharacterized membrane protein